MKERRYTLSEIDRMRRAAWDCAMFHCGWNYNHDSMYRSVEEAVRTYLIGGIGPEEIEEKLRVLQVKNAELDRQISEEKIERALRLEYGPRTGGWK